MELPTAEAKDKLVHPIEVMQRTQPEAEHRQRMHLARATHGWALAAQMSIDNAMLARPTRLGGLRSSNVLQRHYNRTLTRVGAGDILGLPHNNPNVQPSARAIMECDVFGEELRFGVTRVGTH